MACACKVNQEIDKIHKYYSLNGKTAREEKPRLGINGKDAVIHFSFISFFYHLFRLWLYLLSFVHSQEKVE